MFHRELDTPGVPIVNDPDPVDAVALPKGAIMLERADR